MFPKENPSSFSPLASQKNKNQTQKPILSKIAQSVRLYSLMHAKRNHGKTKVGPTTRVLHSMTDDSN